MFSRNRLPQHNPSNRSCHANLPPHELILDGEVTGIWGPASTREADKPRGFAYHVFDILWTDGRDVTSAARRAAGAAEVASPSCSASTRLRSTMKNRGSVLVSKAWEGCQTARLRLRASSIAELAQDEVRGESGTGRGGIYRSGRRVGLGALLVGYDNDDFVFAGKVGTGFDTKLLLDLRAKLDPRDRHASVYQSDRVAAPSRALGATRDRRAGRLHRMDRARQASSSTTVGRSHGQSGSRSGQGAAVITHPDKVLFPDDGITKGALAAYYEAIASIMLPHIRGRPITMERYPSGIGRKGFIQKDVSKGFPHGWSVSRCRRRMGPYHPVVEDPLTALARQSELHHAARVDLARARFLHPDICVFDLDPSREDSNALRDARRLALRDLLDELGLQSWVKTSGSKGFHIVVPLDAKADFGAVHGFAPLAPCSSRAIRND